MLIISMILLTIVMKGGVRSALPVEVNPINPVLKIGQNFTFKCTVAVKLLYCRIQLPGKSSAYNLKENFLRKPDYWYEGAGLNSGQCGITIPQIRDEHNGPFHCAMGTSSTDEEITGSTNITVARAPKGPPELMISPEPDESILRAYKENTTITARCSVSEARPKANLTWYFGDEKTTSGVSEEITERSGSTYRVNQNFTHKLTWRDNAKILRCEANHITYDQGPLSIGQTIEVLFAPQPKETIQKFDLVIGKNGTISVQIQANPSPNVTWRVDNETIHEGTQDFTLRFTASHVIKLGNDTWETSLSISTLTPNDIKRNYSLRAFNRFGEQEYRVITTEAAPKGIETISEECLTCLCEARTDCDFNNLCTNDNSFCGPFSISFGFWQDGGPHFSNISTSSNEESWKKCAKDPSCAAMTVRDYTKRYVKDCNHDGKVDCVDFALIHQSGPSCDKVPPPEQFPIFQTKLDNCLKEIMEYSLKP